MAKRKQEEHGEHPACALCEALKRDTIFAEYMQQCHAWHPHECIRVAHTLDMAQKTALSGCSTIQAVLDKRQFVCNAKQSDADVLQLLLLSLINTTVMTRKFSEIMYVQKVPLESVQALTAGINALAEIFCDARAKTEKTLIIHQ